MNSLNGIIDVLIECIEEEKSLREKIGYELILSYLKKYDSEIRIWIAKALAFDHPDEKTIAVLELLANDIDPLVRAEAIDSLGCVSTSKSYSILKNALDDSDPIVRAYAACGVAELGQRLACSDALVTLLTAMNKEENHYAFVGIYEGLYILGHHDALNRLFLLFDDKDYHIQCWTLRSLCRLYDEENKTDIQAFLETISSNKYPRAVSDMLIRLKGIVAKGTG